MALGSVSVADPRPCRLLAPRRPRDPARRARIVWPKIPRLAPARHLREAALLLRRPLGDRILRVAQMRVVVAPDRADVHAARAARVDAHTAQDRLPAHERLLRLQERLLLFARSLHEALDVAHQVGEPVGRGERGAALLVERPLADRVGGAGEEAAAARLAQAQRLGERTIRFELAA